jgi:FMN phosphatase YigB (HAD superfamily)
MIRAVVFDVGEVLVDEILNVGDRLDDDVRPALAVGMRAAHIRRGPWAFIDRSEVAPTFRIDTF